MGSGVQPDPSSHTALTLALLCVGGGTQLSGFSTELVSLLASDLRASACRLGRHLKAAQEVVPRDVLCCGACKVRAQQIVPEVCRGAASGQEEAGSSLDGVWGSPELERADLSWAHYIVFSGSNISAKTIV